MASSYDGLSLEHPRVLLLGEIPQNTHTNKKEVFYVQAQYLSPSNQLIEEFFIEIG
jgi:hypothetical protein